MNKSYITLPLGMASGFGGLVDGNTPLLCSGYSPSQNENYVHDECFIFSEGEISVNLEKKLKFSILSKNE